MAVWSHSYPGIEIEGDPAFIAACGQDLTKIKGKGDTIGESLLSIISKRTRGIGIKKQLGWFVQIKYTSEVKYTQQMPNEDDNRDVAKTAPVGSIVRLPGKGTGSVIEYGNDLQQQYTQVAGVLTPTYIALAHELCHAMHSLSGDFLKPYDWKTDGALIEEARTVGLGPYKGNRICENSIRKENGLPLRTYYAKPGDCDGLTGVST